MRKILSFVFCVFLSSSVFGQILSEFSPNQPGTDGANQDVEISGGTPSAAFNLWILSIECDGTNIGGVDRAANVTGTYDANGIAAVSIPDLENPSFTIILTDNFTGGVGTTDIDSDDDGTADNIGDLGTILDAIGVPDATGDEANLYGDDLGGENFINPPGGSPEPQLVFRDPVTGDLYWVQDPYTYPTSDVYGLDGSSIPGSYFSSDPSVPSFGTPNTVNSGPLPVELLNFSAKAHNQTTILNWATASEENNAYFDVQRSLDGINFETIGQVQGEGTTYDVKEYSFIDESPVNGLNYYRLHQVDFDGQFANHKVVSVMMNGKMQDVQVYPNPTRGELNIVLPTVGENEIQIFDITGKIVRSFNTADEGMTTVNVSDLTNGQYIIKIRNSNSISTALFVKNR